MGFAILKNSIIKLRNIVFLLSVVMLLTACDQDEKSLKNQIIVQISVPQDIDKNKLEQMMKKSMVQMSRRMEALTETSHSFLITILDMAGFWPKPYLVKRQGKRQLAILYKAKLNPEKLKRLLISQGQFSLRKVVSRHSNIRPEKKSVALLEEILSSNQVADEIIDYYIVKKSYIVSSRHLVDAQPGFDTRTDRPVLAMRFDEKGAALLFKATGAHIGKEIAVILDGKVISSAVVREPILTGSVQISGNFSPANAARMALLLRSEPLPAPFTIIGEGQ